MDERDLKGCVSRLPEGGTNLFQQIKAVSAEAEARGVELVKLSIGQPQGPALESARRAAAEAVSSQNESMHEYQDNGSPGVPDFAKRFVAGHVEIPQNANVDYLPIPGIKPMLGLVQLATGAGEKKLMIAMTTKPGYPTPRDWAHYLNQNVFQTPLFPENDFRFDPDDLPSWTDLVMINYPHNPSGQIATREWLNELCDYCQHNGVRLFNDAAYSALSHSPNSSTLAEVAVDFPNLSWAEAFSASKLIGNGTGWRVGAMVGTPDFIGDIKKIKGNTDSGFVAPMGAGALFALENDQEGIQESRLVYERRIKILTEILESNGMELAVKPQAGFFTLWKAPRYAFGRTMKNAEDFNLTMIEKKGIVGVHFDPYVRYAVCCDVETSTDKIDAAFKEAGIITNDRLL